MVLFYLKSKLSSCINLFLSQKIYKILQNPEYSLLHIQNTFPDLFWTEKVIVIIDYFQFFGLLWIISNPWPWPYIWLQWTRGLVYFNIDLFSTTTHGAIIGHTADTSVSQWGEMLNYLSYVLYFAIGNGILYTMLILSTLLSYYPSTVLKQIHSKLFHPITLTKCSIILLHIAYITYLPTNLALFRLYYCENGRLAVDSKIVCQSSIHLAYAIICSILILPFGIGLPIYLYHIANQAIIYKYESTDHEKYLQIHEISYFINIKSNEYIRRYLPMISSYQLHSVYYKSYILVYKFILLLTYIFARQSLMTQGTIYLFLCIFYIIRFIFYQSPYRCFTTNLIHNILYLLLLGNTFFASINSFHVTNAILVASVESYILLAMNLFMLFLGIAVIGYSFTNSMALYPPLKAIFYIISHEKLFHLVLLWLQTIHTVDKMMTDFLLSPDAIADIRTIEDAIRTVHGYYMEARSLGSIFQNILSDRLVELHTLHAMKLDTAARRNVEWDDIYKKSIQNESLSRYHRNTILMNPKKRRILLKLIATRAFYSPSVKSPRSIESTSISTKNALREGMPPKGKPQNRRGSMMGTGTAEEVDEELNELENRTILELSSNDPKTILNEPVESNQTNQRILHQLEVFDELYYHWNDLILSYEKLEELGYNDITALYSANQVESWYTYRNIIAERIHILSSMGLYDDRNDDRNDNIDNEDTNDEDPNYDHRDNDIDNTYSSKIQNGYYSVAHDNYSDKYRIGYVNRERYGKNLYEVVSDDGSSRYDLEEGIHTVDDEEGLLSRRSSKSRISNYS